MVGALSLLNTRKRNSNVVVRAAVRELNSVQSRYREQNVGLGLRLEGFSLV